MPDDRIEVTFIESHRMYNAGESAAFPTAHAKDLIAQDVARPKVRSKRDAATQATAKADLLKARAEQAIADAEEAMAAAEEAGAVADAEDGGEASEGEGEDEDEDEGPPPLPENWRAAIKIVEACENVAWLEAWLEAGQTPAVEEAIGSRLTELAALTGAGFDEG